MYRYPPRIERIQYEKVKVAIDRATNDIFTRPDVAANIDCCDRINGIAGATEAAVEAILAETVQLLKRKLASKNEEVVLLTLHLVQTIVINGTPRLFRAIDDASFQRELGNVARKFYKTKGGKSREICDISLDIIQGWGETFLPQAARYPNIVRNYQDLRRERLPFKSQYDPSRVPIITPPSVATGRYDDDTDTTPASVRRRSRGSSDNVHASRGSMQRAAANSLFNHLESLDSLGTILKDSIVHSSSAEELMTNEMAREVVESLRSMQLQLASSMEQYIESHPEQIERIFQLNELAINNLQCYDDIISEKLPLSVAKSQIAPDLAENINTSGGSSDLLDVSGNDLLDSPPAPSTNNNDLLSQMGNTDPFGASSSSYTTNSNDFDPFGKADIFNTSAAAATTVAVPTSSSSTNMGTSNCFDELSSMASKPDDDWTSTPSSIAADIFSSTTMITPAPVPPKKDISSQIDNLYAQQQQQQQLLPSHHQPFPSTVPQQPLPVNQYQQQPAPMSQVPSAFPSAQGIPPAPMMQAPSTNHYPQQTMHAQNQQQQQSKPKDNNPFDMF